MDSIREKLLVLPEETRVYPGHGPSTTLKSGKTNQSIYKTVEFKTIFLGMLYQGGGF